MIAENGVTAAVASSREPGAAATATPGASSHPRHQSLSPLSPSLGDGEDGVKDGRGAAGGGGV
jgi:hypothetical protein